MTTARSLEYLLPLLQSQSYTPVLSAEVAALRTIVGDILQDIHGRKSLEHRLLTSLESQASRVHSALLNLRQTYVIRSLDALIAFEHDLETLSLQKTRTQEATAHDLIELKKVLWHYFFLLKQREAQVQLSQ